MPARHCFNNSAVMIIFCLCLPSLARPLTVLTVTHPIEGVSLTITLPHLLCCDVFLSLHLHYLPDPLFEYHLFVCRTLCVTFPPRFVLPTLSISLISPIFPFSLLYSLTLHVNLPTYSSLLTCTYLLTLSDVTSLPFHSSSRSSHTPHHFETNTTLYTTPPSP